MKTISEQPPLPDEIKPRSAAAAGLAEPPVAYPRKIANTNNWPKRLRIAAPKHRKLRRQEQKFVQRSNLTQGLTGPFEFEFRQAWLFKRVDPNIRIANRENRSEPCPRRRTDSVAVGRCVVLPQTLTATPLAHPLIMSFNQSFRQK